LSQIIINNIAPAISRVKIVKNNNINQNKQLKFLSKFIRILYYCKSQSLKKLVRCQVIRININLYFAILFNHKLHYFAPVTFPLILFF